MNFKKLTKNSPGILSAVLILSAFFSCTSLPTMKSNSTDAAVIGIHLIYSDPILGTYGPSQFQEVYFAKLTDTSNLQAAGPIVKSNYSTRSGYLYLLNAEPGDYIPVYASFTQTSGGGPISVTASYNMFFDQDDAKKMILRVVNGKITFAGKVKLSYDSKTRSDYQKHFMETIFPGKFEKMMTTSHVYSGKVLTFENDDKAKTEFMKNSEGRFSRDTSWNYLFK